MNIFTYAEHYDKRRRLRRRLHPSCSHSKGKADGGAALLPYASNEAKEAIPFLAFRPTRHREDDGRKVHAGEAL